MVTKRLFLLILVLFIGCQQAGISQDEPAQPTAVSSEKTAADTQLQFYKDALTDKSSSLQMRVNAADLLLSSSDPAARQVLLDILENSDNGTARLAVCRALSQTRMSLKRISNKEDFIGPLCRLLTAENSAIAKLAAEATLIYEYDQISSFLEGVAADSSRTPRARLSAIYALKLQPDMRAVVKLIELLGDPELQVAAASEKALRPLGIPIGKDAEARGEIIAEIERKGNEAFLRGLIVRQCEQMRELEAGRDIWRNQYLAVLDKYYSGMKDVAARGTVLAEHLAGSEVVVRLWALRKVSEWLTGTETLPLPGEVGPILLGLLSDENRDVRLKTAGLLSLIVGVNSAEKLLEQHKVEQDDEVRTEIFFGLGVVCSSPTKVSPEIKSQVLVWAGEYLAKQDPGKAQKGAEVIKKLLLERNALPTTDFGAYLGLLAQRYGQEKESVDGALRAGLLSTMAGLCAPESACKAESAKLFGALFEQALVDKTDLVREAAVDGLINIDKVRALTAFRKAVLFSDPRIEIRKKVVTLAGEVGGKDALTWLWEMKGSGVESVAWESMLSILKKSDVTVLADWVAKFDSPTVDSGLSNEQRLSVLKIAEQRFLETNRPQALKDVRRQLANLYKGIGNFEQAANYFGMLHETAELAEEKEAILADLLDAYLRWPNAAMAARLVDNYLLVKDLDANCPVALSIDNYFREPPPAVDPNTVLAEFFAKVKEPVPPKPKWREFLTRWTERLGSAEETGKPRKPDE
jgi:HEAT repeat protein